MKKMGTKFGVVALALLLVSGFAMTGCKTKTGGGTYTYNEYISASPTTWNSHIGTSDADSYVQQYTEIGLYDITLNADRTSYAFIDEMATGDPVDVTANYVGQYGISEKQTGKAWKINLNPDATWANGTKITSEDYLYSMEQLLSPQMKNAKASGYYTGTTALYKAYNYYMSVSDYVRISIGQPYTDTEISKLIANGELYFSVNIQMRNDNWRTLAEFHEWTLGKNNAMEKMLHVGNDLSGADIYDTVLAIQQANGDGYVKITADNLATIKNALVEIFETNGGGAFGKWYNHCAIKKETATEYTKVPATVDGAPFTYTDDQINVLIENGQLYFTPEQGILGTGTGQTLRRASVAGRTKQFFYTEGATLKPGLSGAAPDDYEYHGEYVFTELDEMWAAGKNDDGYLKITTENLEDIKKILTDIVNNFRAGGYSAYMTDWYSLLTTAKEVVFQPATFDEIGIFKDGDNAIVLVFTNALTLFDVKFALTSNWLVYKDLYEAGKQQQGSLTLTTYGTSIDNYMGYGPYKLTSYQKDKELVFERNTEWYGFKSGKTNYHEGQYKTDKIVTQVIKEQATALLEFEQGNLDQVKLVSSDLEKYKFSDYMLRRTGGNIWQIAFNTDVTALGALESDGEGNRRILSVTEFRKALSLCLNRNTIGREIAAGSSPAFSFVNENYYYNMQNDSNSVYRTSDEGMKAIVDLYGMEYGDGKTYATLKDAYNAVTGYDIAQAKQNFEAAADKAIADGIYAQGQSIKINIYTNDLNATRSAIGQHMQTQVTEATKGTKLEGKVTIEWKQSSNYSKDIQDGKNEAIFYSIVSDYGDPYGLIGSYVDTETTKIYEYGFDPKSEMFSLTYDFNGDGKIDENETNVPKSYLNWQKAIRVGGEYATNVDARLYVLAQLENKLLGSFRTLPLYVGADVTLRSKKVNYATETANIYAAYGGVRLMTYNYDDADWANYCKKNTLNYAE